MRYRDIRETLVKRTEQSVHINAHDYAGTVRIKRNKDGSKHKQGRLESGVINETRNVLGQFIATPRLVSPFKTPRSLDTRPGVVRADIIWPTRSRKKSRRVINRHRLPALTVGYRKPWHEEAVAAGRSRKDG